MIPFRKQFSAVQFNQILIFAKVLHSSQKQLFILCKYSLAYELFSLTTKGYISYKYWKECIKECPFLMEANFLEMTICFRYNNNQAIKTKFFDISIISFNLIYRYQPSPSIYSIGIWHARYSRLTQCQMLTI